MERIRELIKALNPEQHTQIMKAFNSCESYIIVFEDKTFLAVHTEVNESMVDYCIHGYWLAGVMK